MTTSNLPDIGIVSTAEIDGLSIRYARSGTSTGIPILLTAPWPESLFSFYHLAPLLATGHPVILIDLPGFGHSQSRLDVMAPEAMGDFFVKLLKHFGITRVHTVTPDVGTPAALFAASKHPELFESMIVGGAAMRADLAAGALKDLMNSPVGYLAEAGSDGIKPYLDQAASLTPAAVIEDFRSASAGRRLEEATQYVRGYITDLPKLEPLLTSIKIPALIVSGQNDTIVPPANVEFLASRLPNNRHLLLNADHRIWEEAADEYNKAIISWVDGEYRSL